MAINDKDFISTANVTLAEPTPKKLPLPLNTATTSQTPSNVSTRRRREMQPITMIIETREFPYNDEYVWKNNGNTIHKSTGQKSIYYKCSNNNAVRIPPKSIFSLLMNYNRGVL